MVAVRSGGPLETVADGETGRLCDPDGKVWAEALAPYVEDVSAARRHGAAGRERAVAEFSRERFRDVLEGVLARLAGERSKSFEGVTS